jgi:peroxiredoxin
LEKRCSKVFKFNYLEKICISEAVSVLISIPIAMTPTCMTSKSTANKIIKK